MESIRFGVVGAGQISQNCCKAINAHDSAQVVAAAEPNEERLRALCEQYEITRAYASADEMFADDQVDAVYIAVPNSLHAPMAIAALEQGKHVLLEKPMAISAAEAEAVAAAAERAGKLIMVGMNQRMTADAQKAYQARRDGLAGEIYHAKAWWYRRSGIPKLGTWFGNKKLAGGGCLYDIGVHLLDLCLFTMGNFQVASVFGRTHGRFGHRGLGEGGWGKSDADPSMIFDVDDFASALLRMENGSTVMLEVSWARHQRENGDTDVELLGDDACISVKPATVHRPGEEDYLSEEITTEPELAHCCRFQHFVNVLLGREENIIPVEQSVMIQRVLDAIYQSCATGEVVHISQEKAHVSCA